MMSTLIALVVVLVAGVMTWVAKGRKKVEVKISPSEVPQSPPVVEEIPIVERPEEQVSVTTQTGQRIFYNRRLLMEATLTVIVEKTGVENLMFSTYPDADVILELRKKMEALNCTLQSLHEGVAAMLKGCPSRQAYSQFLWRNVVNNRSNKVRQVSVGRYGLASRWITTRLLKLTKEAMEQYPRVEKQAEGELVGDGLYAVIPVTSDEPPPHTGQGGPSGRSGGGGPHEYVEVPNDLKFERSVLQHKNSCWRARGEILREKDGNVLFYHPPTTRAYPVIRMIYVALEGEQPPANLVAGCGLQGAARQCCVNPYPHSAANPPTYVTIWPLVEERMPSDFTIGSVSRAEEPLPSQEYLLDDCRMLKSSLYGHRGLWNMGLTRRELLEMFGVSGERLDAALRELGPGKGMHIYLHENGKHYPSGYIPRQREVVK